MARGKRDAAGMYDDQKARLTDAELHAFFDRLFPHDVWPTSRRTAGNSPVLACFHPSLEQRYEAVQLHRNLEELSRAMRRGDAPERKPRPEPTLHEFQTEYRAEPVNVHEGPGAFLTNTCIEARKTDGARAITCA